MMTIPVFAAHAIPGEELQRAGSGHNSTPPIPPPASSGDVVMEAAAVIAWAFRRFRRRRLMMTTGFGMEGCALIDLLARHGTPVKVFYLDTHFLFEQTHALLARLAERYPSIRFENRGTPLTPLEQEVLHGPRLWSSNPDLCCQLRKVEPMRVLLEGADAWMTALRRGQSEARASIRSVEWDDRFELVKIHPLARWSREQVWSYITTREVPYNPLHDQGYPSIGCTHCTAAVAGAGPQTYSREGRWAGTEKSECGLHTPAEAAWMTKQPVTTAGGQP